MLNLFKAKIINSEVIQNASYCTDNNKIYRIGGNLINDTLTNKVYEFIPGVDDQFRLVATLPTYLTSVGSFIAHNTLYIIGGVDNKDNPTNNVYSIKLNNICSSQWKEEPLFPEKTFSASIAITNKSVFALGNGYDPKDKGSNKIYKAIFKDGELDHWHTYLEMPLYFTYSQLLNKDNNLIIIGGFSNMIENDTVYIVDNKVTVHSLKIYSSEKINHFYYNAFSHDGVVYKIGGAAHIGNDNYKSILSVFKMHRFDNGLSCQTTKWEQISLIPMDLVVNKLVVVKGTLYAFPEHTTKLNNISHKEDLNMYTFEIKKPYSGIQQRKS